MCVIAALDFLPTMIAFARQHPERVLLATLNILSLLWFLLWFALLVRAVGDTANRRRLAAGVGALALVGIGGTARAVTRYTDYNRSAA